MIDPIRRSPVARMHTGLGAIVEVEARWEIVGSYGAEDVERVALAETAALVDVTPRGKIDLRGRIQGATDAASDSLCARVADDWALLLTAPGEEEPLLGSIETAAGPGAMVTDATHLLAGFALGGPRLHDVLARVTSWDPSSLEPGSATGAPITDVPAIVFRRDALPSVMEVYIGSESARYVWEVLLDVVRSLGGHPAGWRALRAEGWR
jgi:glycine cleavage system aminomethyltransferase T